MRKILGLGIFFVFCSVIACTAPVTTPTPSPPFPPLQVEAEPVSLSERLTEKSAMKPAAKPAFESAEELPEGLTVTAAAVEFDDTKHKCPTAYSSQVTDMTFNKEKLRTGYKIETACTATDETHIQSFSNITYNQFGQRSGYRLQLSCSRTGGEYNVNVSKITYDKNWGVLSYTAEINGNTYYYNR